MVPKNKIFMRNKIINHLVTKGKSSISEKIFLKSIKLFCKLFNKNHTKSINKALVKITPLIKVKKLKQKRKRSTFKEFPYILSSKIRLSASLKFFINKKKSKSVVKAHNKFIKDLLNAVTGSGLLNEKKKSIYEYAFVKKKFFYYRWF